MILNPPPRPTVTGLDTVDEALAALEAAVATRGPGYIYPHNQNNPNGGMCVYVEGDQPSCLIGLVLHRAGVPLEWFTTPSREAGNRNQDSATRVCRELGIGDDVADVLRRAQLRQDGGSSWAVALDAARAFATQQPDTRVAA